MRFVTAIDGFGAPTRTFTLGNDSRLGLPADGSVFLGASPFIHATGTRNAFMGATAGNAVSTGFENAAFGHEALLANTAGAGNTAVGYRAMASMTDSFNSTAVGAQALANATSAGNIALGSFAGVAITTGANNIAIGSTGDAGDADTMRLGGGQSRAFIAGVRGITTGSNNAIPVLIDTNGQLGTASSSRRFKDDIEAMGEASEGLMHLRPVTFHYKADNDPSGKRLQYGLIAEEVAAVYPGLVAHSPDGQVETVMYQFLPPMLLNEVQKQQRTIEAQAAEIASLKAQAGRLAAVEQELAAIRQALGIR
ncbi:MAG: tail fiber domain-containing protein [Betaproteobacteria bacterium]|nr:tail fiber domain-containing protein [Betaproteobacteria bacterium]